MRIVLSMLVAVGTLAATEVLAQAPSTVGQSDREFRPPSEAGKASRAARAQARDQAQRPTGGAPATRVRNSVWWRLRPSMETGASPSIRRAARANRAIVSRWRSSTAMSYTKANLRDGSRPTAASR